MTQEFVTLPREVVEQALDSLLNEGGFRKILKPLIEKSIESIREALEQPQDHVPDAGNMVLAGWKLVPMEPTIRQMAAMGPAIRACYDMDGVSGNVIDVYRAMLAAAPQPPTAEQSSAVERQQDEQEPVAGVVIRDGLPCLLQDRHIKSTDHRVYTHPQPKREPLTDMQKMMCWSRATHDADVLHKTEHQCLMDYASEIEAAHNIK